MAIPAAREPVMDDTLNVVELAEMVPITVAAVVPVERQMPVFGHAVHAAAPAAEYVPTGHDDGDPAPRGQ